MYYHFLVKFQKVEIPRYQPDYCTEPFFINKPKISTNCYLPTDTVYIHVGILLISFVLFIFFSYIWLT